MTRDAFSNHMNPGYRAKWSCASTQFQSSIVSVTASPVTVPADALDGLSERDRWIVRSDLEKGFLPSLTVEPPDVIVVDLWADVFFGFRTAGESFVTNNYWALTESALQKFSPEMARSTVVSLEEEPALFRERWAESAALLAGYLRENVPQSLVILHRGTFTDRVLDTEVERSLSESGLCRVRDIQRLNSMWHELDDMAERLFADAAIDLGGHRYPSTTTHRWGAGYVHYVGTYYADFLTALDEVVNAELARRT